jgi:hypothetical protein
MNMDTMTITEYNLTEQDVNDQFKRINVTRNIEGYLLYLRLNYYQGSPSIYRYEDFFLWIMFRDLCGYEKYEVASVTEIDGYQQQYNVIYRNEDFVILYDHENLRSFLTENNEQEFETQLKSFKEDLESIEKEDFPEDRILTFCRYNDGFETYLDNNEISKQIELKSSQVDYV